MAFSQVAVTVESADYGQMIEVKPDGDGLGLVQFRTKPADDQPWGDWVLLDQDMAQEFAAALLLMRVLADPAYEKISTLLPLPNLSKVLKLVTA